MRTWDGLNSICLFTPALCRYLLGVWDRLQQFGVLNLTQHLTGITLSGANRPACFLAVAWETFQTCCITAVRMNVRTFCFVRCFCLLKRKAVESKCTDRDLIDSLWVVDFLCHFLECVTVCEHIIKVMILICIPKSQITRQWLMFYESVKYWRRGHCDPGDCILHHEFLKA